MSRLKYAIIYEVDKEFLVDEETLKEEFNNDWQEWLQYFSKVELGEVITGMGTDPVSIEVVDE